MNRKFKSYNLSKQLLIVLFLSYCTFSQGFSPENEILELSLNEVIVLAQHRSLESLVAKYELHLNELAYLKYRSIFLPKFSLSGSFPTYNRSITEELLDTSHTFTYIETNTNHSNIQLNMEQNIPLTGGSISVNSRLSRLDNFGSINSTQYSSTPVSISYNQTISRHNEFKWSKKIEPYKYQVSKKEYVVAMQDITIQAINNFFNLVEATMSLEIAELNYQNADTLYRISQGRFNMGVIARNELLTMELGLLNAEIALSNATFNLETIMSELQSFLGYTPNVIIKPIFPDKVPSLQLNYDEVYSKLTQNNPEYLSLQLELLEAEKKISSAKTENGVNINLSAGVGYAQSGDNIVETYEHVSTQQSMHLGFSIPIVDWKLAKSNYKLAEENYEITQRKIEKARFNIEQQIFIEVMQFNLLEKRLEVSRKANSIAQERYNITEQRFINGTLNVTDLNIAKKERDESKTDYISAIRNYWNAYYSIQKKTLYDFIHKISLVDTETK